MYHTQNSDKQTSSMSLLLYAYKKVYYVPADHDY